MSELLHITIDGKDCTCEKGEYLWDVAKRNGVFIPVFCRSDAFPDHRACCRVCIVEVEIRGRSKVVTSCVYPVEQECVVRTDSDRIKEERSVVLGLLAARAPEAQRVALLSKINGNDGFERLTVLDGEKCILCGLCVQACESLGTSAISTVNRRQGDQHPVRRPVVIVRRLLELRKRLPDRRHFLYPDRRHPHHLEPHVPTRQMREVRNHHGDGRVCGARRHARRARRGGNAVR